MNSLKDKDWKDIPEFEGAYQASLNGEIRSVERIISDTRKVKKYNSILRKPYVNKKGYCILSLKNIDGKLRTILCHRLIAITFIPNPDNKTTVNHKNGIKTDNRVENLEWATSKEQVRHSYDNKLQTPKSGEESNWSKVVLNTETGIYYYGAPEAYSATDKKISLSHFKCMLSESRPNKTKFIFT